MALLSTVLTANISSIYTSNGNSVVTTMYFCNTGNITAEFSLYAVPAGANAGISNAIYYMVPLTSHDTYVIDTERLMFENGDGIFANIVIDANIDANLMPMVVATITSIGI